MIGKKMSRVAGPTLLVCLALAGAAWCFASSQVIDRELKSKSLSQSKVGTNPLRRMAIYLPPSYERSTKRYPVIYFFPDAFGSYRDPFDRKGAQAVFDKAITDGSIGGFILVAADIKTSLGSSWGANSAATGNWEDFVIQELVPYVDANFRTLPQSDSRGVAGEFMGGYAAIHLAMRHPEIFSSVYALHPVGTGSGLKVMDSLPNWEILSNAKSLDDVRKDGYSTIFTTIFQAFLADPDKPPLFIDLPAHKEGDRLLIDPKLTERLRMNFFLESQIPQYAENLKSLRGFKFDWGRSDLNQDHVYSNQAFTHKLNEFGIPHEAEEYNGTWGESNWGEDGRVYAEVLPFFHKHLVFDGQR